MYGAFLSMYKYCLDIECAYELDNIPIMILVYMEVCAMLMVNCEMSFTPKGFIKSFYTRIFNLFKNNRTLL